MRALARTVLGHRWSVVFAWVALVAGASVFTLRLERVLQGGAEPIPGSPSDRVNDLIQERFGPGSLFQFLVVLRSEDTSVFNDEFRRAAQRIDDTLAAISELRTVKHHWNLGLPDLLGSDDRSALLLVTPEVGTHHEAEKLTPELREAIALAGLPPGFTAEVTSMSAMFHDLDQNSSSDLLDAEKIGLPITLVILLVVFGAPIAASIPLLLAITSVVVSLAALYFLSEWTPISLFAQNAVSMIGLGVGTDYALFLLSRYRQELRGGCEREEAIVQAVVEAGHAVLFSGITVALGFLGLLLANAPVLHSIALGGVAVVTVAVAASLTLLPALLSLFGSRTYWPRSVEPLPTGAARRGGWARWANLVMRRPWSFLVLGAAVVGVFLVPLARIESWNIGANDLDPSMESRTAYDALDRQFAKGWIGPTVLVFEVDGEGTLWDASAQEAILSIYDRLDDDERVDTIGGFAELLESLRLFRMSIDSAHGLPETLKPLAPLAVTADGKTALTTLFTREAPESREAMGLIADLRAEEWAEAGEAGVRVHVGGWTAIRADLDHELYGSLWRIVPVILVATFVILLVLFRSIVIPIKATVLNLLSVLAAYGFLVYVFQDGVGAEWIGLVPPGGLNPFIVVALFTVLFGLSMDYEVFLLTRIQEEYRASGDGVRAVEVGLQETAGIITSAALIMVSIFTAFGFTKLVVTRQLGFGLAFAIALDAAVLRTIVAPALMALAGRWNWWLPGPIARWLPAPK